MTCRYIMKVAKKVVLKELNPEIGVKNEKEQKKKADPGVISLKVKLVKEEKPNLLMEEEEPAVKEPEQTYEDPDFVSFDIFYFIC